VFGGEDARYAGQVVGDQEIGPERRVEEGADGGERVVAEFEDKQAAWLEVASGLGDELGVEFVAFFAAEEGGGGFVVAHFDRKRDEFFASDIGRVGDN
jgi:hypothetical protein